MANTLKFGGGTWATKKGSTLAYSDTNNAFKPLPFNFTRNSIATRVNKEGLIEVVGNDIPRIDYTDSTDGALLLENSATNLLTYSEDYSTWNKVVSSNTNFSTVNPKGTTDTQKITQTSSGGYIEKARTFIGNETFSVFVKKDTSDFVRLYAAGNSVYFNIFKGTIETISGSVQDKSIINYGNGWFRISITVNSTSSSYVRIYPSSSGSSTSGLNSLFVWGAMLEANSVASSYIPTNGSTVQRASETCNGSGNSEVFNDSQGVLFANIAALSDDSTFRAISISDASYSNRCVLRYGGASNRTNVLVVSSGSTVFDNNSTSLNILNYNKIVLKYKQNDFSFWINGFEVATDTSGNTPSGLSQLQFADAVNSGTFLYGKTKELGYYDTALTDAELEYLTSYRSLNEMVTELNLNAL